MARRGGPVAGFVLAGLAAALVIGTVVSNFAASTPDALQRAVIDSACRGAQDVEACLAAYEGAPVLGAQPAALFDYGVTWLSGLVGVILCFAIGTGVLLLLRKGAGGRRSPAERRTR
ncbi:MAG: PDGLE domain-containing protein [Actinomycetota bacterium]